MTKTPENTSADFNRRDFLKGGAVAAAVSVGSLGAFYFGYGQSVGKPVRVGVIGTGDEGSVLLGALNPKFVEVKAIADIRPYNVFRAFHGEYNQPVRPGLCSVYGWKNETEARKHVKVYGHYMELLKAAKADGIEAIICALPLHLHAPCCIAAMQRGLHVITEKLMAHSVHECKEMAMVADQQDVYLAVGHQRHYNILYAQATEKIRRGMLGDLHHIRAQWHRSNLPGKDSWQQPLPPGVKADEKVSSLAQNYVKLQDALGKARGAEIEVVSRQLRQLSAQIADRVLHSKDLLIDDPKDSKKKIDVLENLKGTAAYQAVEDLLKLHGEKTPSEVLGYENTKFATGKGSYDRPALEELIRWRLFERTSRGLMAELGSHQLDAASIFVAAAHGGHKQHPLNVTASAARSLFPRDRDAEDHVLCLIEFPAPGYDPKDPIAAKKKIGVMYSSINGNGFGGYGEIVYGTKGTLILEREQLMHEPSSGTEIKVSAGGGGPTLDTQSSGPVRAVKSSGEQKVSRGYAEEIEHWAWCIRNKAPENQPRCGPKVAMGDAIIALVTNTAAATGQRMEFEEAWFDPKDPSTPEKIAPDITRYTA
jgi:predicted dehydrogenase